MNLVDDETFFKYILGGDEPPTKEIKKREIIETYKINNAYKNDLNRLINLFRFKITDYNLRKKAIKFIHKNHNCPDMFIYNVLRNMLKNSTEDTFKDNKRGNSMKNTLERYKSKWEQIKPSEYLDVGCYQGDITKSVGEYFNLKKDKIHGIDIKQYIETEDFTYTVYDGINIPYEDNKFDVITCFMILHHIPNDSLEGLLKEIYRVMKPGGFLLLREHNADKHDYDILDILHSYYDYILTNATWDNPICYYNTIDYWTEKLVGVGFKETANPDVKKNNPKNPFNNYINLYKK
jgi:SAM-dependent methyltransferase